MEIRNHKQGKMLAVKLSKQGADQSSITMWEDYCTSAMATLNLPVVFLQKKKAFIPKKHCSYDLSILTVLVCGLFFLFISV